MELPLIKVLKPAGFQLCCIATHTATRYSVGLMLLQINNRSPVSNSSSTLYLFVQPGLQGCAGEYSKRAAGTERGDKCTRGGARGTASAHRQAGGTKSVNPVCYPLCFWLFCSVSVRKDGIAR